MRAGNYRSSRPRCDLVTLLRITVAFILLCTFGGLTAAAQGRDGVKRDQAVLHIQATIVPAVADLNNRGGNQHDLAINYNLPQSDFRLCVTEESRYLSIESERTSRDQVVLLRTTTVIPK